MFIRIIGIMWVGLGATWFIRPSVATRKLHKKSLKRIRLFGFLTFLGGGIVLVVCSRLTQGFISYLIAAVGVAFCIQGVRVLRSKVLAGGVGVFFGIPLWLLRLYASIFILLGVLLVLISM